MNSIQRQADSEWGTYAFSTGDIVVCSTELVQTAVNVAGYGAQLTETGGLGAVAAVVVPITLCKIHKTI